VIKRGRDAIRKMARKWRLWMSYKSGAMKNINGGGL